MGFAQQVAQIWNRNINSNNIVYTTYPTDVAPLADVTGVVCTADAAGSKYGAVATVVAAGPASAFWIAAVSVNTASAADQFQVAVTLGAGDTLAWESGIMDLSAVTANVPPIWLPVPVRSVASAKIGAKIANLDAVARTLNVSVTVGTGFGT